MRCKTPQGRSKSEEHVKQASGSCRSEIADPGPVPISLQ